MATSEGAAWRKFLKPLVGAAVLFCTASGWTIGINTNNSKLAGMSLGIAFGVDFNEGWPFKDGTKIFKAGTYVKYNGVLVWGKELT